MIRTYSQYLGDIINNHKTLTEWEIRLSLAVDFVSSKDFKETRTMSTNNDNIDITIGYETDQIIEELFNFFLQRHQRGLEEKMRGSKFFYDSINLLCYKLHKIGLNCGGSNIDSPEWLKHKKATINPTNNDDKYFQYAVMTMKEYLTLCLL